ncbi:tyrosyl-dna phosphodiesterase [Stylonychia lemnae]|uniref:Tyrosyl-dna phosphodiesterase n=1 Tax=Stylonychia lemnae TaxID=5949 RepID=A0A078BBX9_STYLE|nr:tyrosyl-dna phosphodiesterase [Stylonychia lemnae]|eukprot:CDW91716.1 tyrosyl-dna phosphodiesterase [Stylonychia lemnae]
MNNKKRALSEIQDGEQDHAGLVCKSVVTPKKRRPNNETFIKSKEQLQQIQQQNISKPQKRSSESSYDEPDLDVKFISDHNPVQRQDKEEAKNSQREVDELKEEQKEICIKFDGTKLYTNRIKFYYSKAKIDNALSFKQLMSKDLLDEKDPGYDVDVKSAIFASFEYEEDLMLPLFSRKIPTTIFEDQIKRTDPLIFFADDEINCNKINVNKYDTVPYASYHSKVIIYQFEDRLRVILSSANLTNYMWYYIQQCIWAQDFPLLKLPSSKSKLEERKSENDFKHSLGKYLEHLVPWNVRKNPDVFRQKINLDDYDFSKAQVHLVESINGRLKGDKISEYGLMRINSLIKQHHPLPEKSKIWIQASSIGRMWPKYLQDFYYTLTGILISEERIHDRFGFIYPTESHARKSNLGINNCDCLHLKTTSWRQKGFPTGSFYRYEGRTELFNEDIAHSKVLIITDDDKGTINDNTFIYIGSHNMSSNAWGKFERNKEQFTIANWELGVSLIPKADSKDLKQSWIESLCFKFPPVKYKFGDIPYFGDVDYK